MVSKIPFSRYKSFVKNIIDGWILRSIQLTYDATRDKKSEATPLVAYLLLSCAIDIVSGFYVGRTDPKSRTAGSEYKQFVSKYMSTYSVEAVYKGLRCDLAHNFVLGDNIVLTHAHPERHKILERGREVWNFENLFDDFKKAVEQYFVDLDSSLELQEKFVKRFKAIGIADSLAVDPSGRSFS